MTEPQFTDRLLDDPLAGRTDREAAAKTVTVPESFAEDDDFGVPEEPDVSSEEEQALRASSAAAPTPATCRVRVVRRVRCADRVITDLLPRKL